MHNMLRLLQKRVTILELVIPTPTILSIRNKNEVNSIKNDIGKNILIPSVNITSLIIRLKNLSVSLRGDIDDFPILFL